MIEKNTDVWIVEMVPRVDTGRIVSRIQTHGNVVVRTRMVHSLLEVVLAREMG